MIESQITNIKQLEKVIEEMGILPFMRCKIPGYSLEEKIDPRYWFEGEVGAWEWREQIAAAGQIAYAKLFNNKAGFVSMEWYPDLCNYRRDGYDFDARYEDGLASWKCKKIIDILTNHGPMLSGDLKKAAGFGKEGEKGFETAITLLQMQTYITVKEFVYKRDKLGHPYGWGTGLYELTEDVYGAHITTGKYHWEPIRSRDIIAGHILELFPTVGLDTIHKFLK